MQLLIYIFSYKNSNGVEITTNDTILSFCLSSIAHKALITNVISFEEEVHRKRLILILFHTGAYILLLFLPLYAAIVFKH